MYASSCASLSAITPEKLPIEGGAGKAGEYVLNLANKEAKCLPEDEIRNEFKWSLQLHGTKAKFRPKSTNTRGKRKTLTSREQKRLQVYQPKPQDVKFAKLIPLYHLWEQYIRSMIGMDLSSADNRNNIQIRQRLCKADYHGALLTVSASTCQNYTGVTGILMKETRNTLQLVTAADRLITIPKSHTEFTFWLDGYKFTLHGNHFRVKSSERAVKKTKEKSSLRL